MTRATAEQRARELLFRVGSGHKLLMSEPGGRELLEKMRRDPGFSVYVYRPCDRAWLVDLYR